MSDNLLHAVTPVVPISQAPIQPYAFNSEDFCYSLRCTLCRHEVEHTREQHLILSRGIAL